MSKRRKHSQKRSPSVRQTHQSHQAHPAHNRRQRGANAILHLSEPDEARWRWLPYLLVAAFLLRALVALAGDFAMHPDEVMQYLEQGHRLAFGAGVMPWEFIYGGRSLLTPGLVAGVLLAANAVGLGEPTYYVPLVKLVFCALSLLIPLGMYVFGRRHFGELSGRIALLLGCFWYELIVFAHKPMTEFTATALLFGLLALVSVVPCSVRRGLILALLATLAAAVRMQYAPIVGLVLLVEFVRTTHHARIAILVGGLLGLCMVGLFEKLTWGNWFHSYLLNFRLNILMAEQGFGENSAFWQLPFRQVMASCGLVLVALAAGIAAWRRRGWLLLICLVILLLHITQPHQEYRFVFLMIPFWLLLLADFAAATLPRLAAINSPLGSDEDDRPLEDKSGNMAKQTKVRRNINRQAWGRPAACLTAALLVSVAGILNGLPWLSPSYHPRAEERFNHVYRGFSNETGRVGFLRDHDTHFRIYRQLAADDSVEGVLDATHYHFTTAGYYYLHRAVPYYDMTIVELFAPPAEVPHYKYVSHIISKLPMEVGDVPRDETGVYLVARFVERSDEDDDPGWMRVSLPAYVLTQTPEMTPPRLVYWDRDGQPTPMDSFEEDEAYGDEEYIVFRTTEPGQVVPWKRYQPTAPGVLEMARRLLGPDTPPPPPFYGVEFVEQ
ncbi:MAG: hypothetical protein ACR2PR_08245 [Pseudohongiellaceae bacterium]